MSAPSPEEAHLYYYDGLTPGPKLIARSSTHAWQLGTPRMALPITEATHPLVLERLFLSGENDLLDQILDTVAGLEMTAITLLHLGARHEDWQTVLVIDVAPGTLGWEDGRDVVMRCKALMEHHGIHDVHCEIREAVVADDDDGQAAQARHHLALAYHDDVDGIEFWF